MTPTNVTAFPTPTFNPGNRMPGIQQGYNQYYINNNPAFYNYFPLNFQGTFPMDNTNKTNNTNFQQQNNNNNKNQNQKGNFNKQNPISAKDLKSKTLLYCLFSPLEVMDKILESCRDQNGSRIIQLQFESADKETKDKIFQQILPEAYQLMTDVFGNYVIQRILDLGTDEQRLALYDTMKGHFFELSQHTYGCRVIQKAIDVTYT